jgi:putative chitinase
MELTLEQLQEILPTNKELAEWLPLLNDILPKYGIETPGQVAHFLSQTGHESADLRVLSENLNYGAAGLLSIFRKYFDGPTATLYERKPARIANRVYANRMGNGDESSGDGWKYRGRGLLQVTGRDNYKACSQALFGNDTLLDNPDLLLTKEFALRSACWFWAKNSLNEVSDVAAVTKRVNGGTNGLSDRQARFEGAVTALA